MISVSKSHVWLSKSIVGSCLVAAMAMGCTANTKDSLGSVEIEGQTLGAADSVAAFDQGELPLGELQEGNLTRRFPRHYYRVEIERAGTYFVDFASREGDDLAFILYQLDRGTWRHLDHNDDCYPGTLNACLETELEAGSYLILASTYRHLSRNHRVPADYHLTVTCQDCVDCPDPDAADVHYVSQDPSFCARARFACEDGQTPFSNECGCGCVDTPSCIVSGCSSQVCVDSSEGPVFTTCEWREEYACYQQVGTCERQADGACGWTETDELNACLEDPSALSDCRTTGCGEGQYCTLCWANFACIPEGAVC